MITAPANNNQLTDFEFETLTNAGSHLVEKMIMQRVRIQDTPASLVDDAIEYLDLNTRNGYYIRRGYHHVNVYFVDPIDCENFSLVLKSYAKNTVV